MKSTNRAIAITITIIAVTIIFCIFFTYPKNQKCRLENKINVPIQPKNWESFRHQFRNNNIVLIEDLFEPMFFKQLQNDVLKNEKENRNRTATLFNSVRKAGTVSSSRISSPIRELYQNVTFLKFLRDITGLPLENVNCNDKSDMNILVYDKPGDFISWHFDPNHYVGKRLTVLISITNSSEGSSSLSSSKLEYKLRGDPSTYSIQMKPNSILVFDGSEIEHRATGIGENEHRVVLSFTYCDICSETIWGNFVKRCKELVMGY